MKAVRIEMSDESYATIKAAADLDALPVTRWVTMTLLRHIRGDLSPRPTAPPGYAPTTAPPVYAPSILEPLTALSQPPGPCSHPKRSTHVRVAPADPTRCEKYCDRCSYVFAATYPRCPAIKPDGERCSAAVMKQGADRCGTHAKQIDPELAERMRKTPHLCWYVSHGETEMRQDEKGIRPYCLACGKMRSGSAEKAGL